MVMTFKQIFTNEGMQMPNKYGFRRVQSFNSDKSIAFEFDDKSRDFLRNYLEDKLNIMGKIYEPTLKKIAENIIILNRQKHVKTHVSRIRLMNEPNYDNYRNSSFCKSIE